MNTIRALALGLLAVALASCTGNDGGEPPAKVDASPPVKWIPRPEAPDVESLDWVEVGLGVGVKDALNPAGEGVFVGFAGWQVTDFEARAWVSALYTAALRDLGVRYLYAVRGPSEVQYESRELANTRLIEDLVPRLAGREGPALVVAHSSGAYVACELFELLFEGNRDPEGVTSDRLVYYNLDGAYSCLRDVHVENLHRLYFVLARQGDGRSLNAQGMASGARKWSRAGRLLAYEATRARCGGDARRCLHASLVNTRPHDPHGSARTDDYSSFGGRPVNQSYLDATADAILLP